MKLGCGTLLYGGHSLERAIQGICRGPFTHIELGAMPGMAPHLEPDRPLEEYRHIKGRIRDAGLTIESVGASCNLADDQARERFKRLLDAAAQVGAPYVTSGPGGAANDEESWSRVLDIFRTELIPAAEAAGVRLSIKPHVNSVAYNCGTALRFMAELNSETVRLNYDSSHIYRAHEDPAATLNALAPWIATGRIRDMCSRSVSGPGPVETQIPGNGEMPLESIARAFGKVPGLEVVTLEIVGAKDLAAEEVDSVVIRSGESLSRLSW